MITAARGGATWRVASGEGMATRLRFSPWLERAGVVARTALALAFAFALVGLLRASTVLRAGAADGRALCDLRGVALRRAFGRRLFKLFLLDVQLRQVGDFLEFLDAMMVAKPTPPTPEFFGFARGQAPEIILISRSFSIACKLRRLGVPCQTHPYLCRPLLQNEPMHVYKQCDKRFVDLFFRCGGRLDLSRKGARIRFVWSGTGPNIKWAGSRPTQGDLNARGFEERALQGH